MMIPVSRTVHTALLLVFVFLPFTHSASAQATFLCFTTFDCPDGATCEYVGSQEGGRGICTGLPPSKDAPPAEDNSPTKLVNLLPSEASTLEGLINVVMKAVVQIGSILLVLALMWTGFLFIQAQGKEEQIRSARQALMWTVLGGILLLGAQALSLIISSAIKPL